MVPKTMLPAGLYLFTYASAHGPGVLKKPLLERQVPPPLLVCAAPGVTAPNVKEYRLPAASNIAGPIAGLGRVVMLPGCAHKEPQTSMIAIPKHRPSRIELNLVRRRRVQSPGFDCCTCCSFCITRECSAVLSKPNGLPIHGTGLGCRVSRGKPTAVPLTIRFRSIFVGQSTHSPDNQNTHWPRA